ncbi:flagellar assembly protein FliH [Clostridium tagluense]|uniref:FliH/SctL family protein n=1 Tax=Clostridium tagluense TaxID=360422 RepID=UPI001C0D1D9A|nr:flagellar assembly protein FliH [Clostridium tagluense]MBU3126646.1 flagellar assembly protein FliH [Clostridium tagluense]MCB2310014.1 flagellar assembly protein FliH [Clostridium tagluense]MCB2314456.1 flagellar assembly protein FliH [Clostridium tagluense]MCB2319304.1 flagellar assembly protein FliH [Clostridium tagluense]MCB2324608.1 flagellar assembly protein FliH [Clostridium tagluense]
MRSSFNVIKNSRVINQGNKEINTQLSGSSVVEILEENHETEMDNIASYENIASNIVENAQKESEKIISKAFVNAAEAKALAFKEGIEEGHKEGYENGYNEAIEAARQEAQKIRGDADSILVAAKAEYNDYLIEKEQHIKALVVSIAENILKREVVEKNALDEMIFNCIKDERNIKSYIIKSNSSHFAAIKEQIENWKGRLAFQGDIFVIEDNFLDDGTAVIEKDTGKSIVSISYGIEKIIEIFQQEQIQI